MKKIFITGVAGFLGSHLADALIAKGYEVSGNDSLIGGYLDNVPDAVNFHQVDCCYLNTMNKMLKGIDIVVHTACTAYEGLSVFSPHLVTQNTSQITSTLLSAAIQQNVGRFIFCSSMARYGANTSLPFSEELIPRPQDPYGIAKVAAEGLVKNLAETHGMEHIIAVPHNIIGSRQKYDDPYRNVASIMTNLMLQDRRPYIYGDGTQVRCFSFIDDCVDSLVAMVERDGLDGQVINIGPDQDFISINQLFEHLRDLTNKDLEPIYVPGRPQEVKEAYCSSDKARELLGYEPKLSLRDGLAKIVEYIKERGPKKFRYHLDVEIINELTPKTWSQKLF